MSIKISKKSGVSQTEDLAVPTSITIVKDQLLADDVSNKGWIPATSSSTTLTIRAIAQDPEVTVGSTGIVRAILLEEGQLVIADCTNNTAANQIAIRHALTDGLTVNNTSSEQTGTTGIMKMIKPIGVAADKKALFQVMMTNVTS